MKSIVGEQELLNEVINNYRQNLLDSTYGLAFLEKYRLNDPELITQFHLGFASNTLLSKVSPDYIRLREIGIINISGDEYFSGSLVIPVRDREGNIAKIYGYATHEERYLDGSSQYLSILPSGMWNEASLGGFPATIICDSLFDAMSFWVSGYRHVISADWDNVVIEEQVQTLKKHGIRQAIIAFGDNWEGDSTVSQLVAELLAEGLSVLRINLPGNMSVNDYLRNVSMEQFCQLPGTAKPVSFADLGICIKIESKLCITLFGWKWDVSSISPVMTPEMVKINLDVRLIDNSKSFSQMLSGCPNIMDVDSLEYIAQIAVKKGYDLKNIRRSLKYISQIMKQRRYASETQLQIRGGRYFLKENGKEAMDFLYDHKLLTRIANDMATLGAIGDAETLLVGYLTALSCIIDKNMDLLIHVPNKNHRSVLMDVLLSLIPEEKRLIYSSLRAEGFCTPEEIKLSHKILAVHEEKDVQHIIECLKTNKSLSVISSQTNLISNTPITKEHIISGRPTLMLTTTGYIDNTLAERCFVLTDHGTDEKSVAGKSLMEHVTLSECEKKKIIELHQNAWRLLRSMHVYFPSNVRIIPLEKPLVRYEKQYRKLIQMIALLQQQQRLPPMPPDIKEPTDFDEMFDLMIFERKRYERSVKITFADVALAHRLMQKHVGPQLETGRQKMLRMSIGRVREYWGYYKNIRFMMKTICMIRKIRDSKTPRAVYQILRFRWVYLKMILRQKLYKKDDE